MITEVEKLHLEVFSMGEVMNATGLSRTALIKLEKAGILKPYHVDKRTGYRSYTIIEISNVIQYRLFREMNISQDEILDYFSNRDHLIRIIEKMKVKKNLMQRAIEELELRLGTDEECSFSFIDIPDLRCYCGKSEFTDPGEIEKYTAKIVEEAVRLGFTRLSYEPLFSMRWDTQIKTAGNPDDPYEAMVCVPIEKDFVSDKDLPGNRIGHIETICGGRVFSLLYHGGYKAPDFFNPIFRKFWDEIKKRKLRTVGPVRGIGIVCGATGLDIDPDDYVFRFAVLVDHLPQNGR